MLGRTGVSPRLLWARAESVLGAGHREHEQSSDRTTAVGTCLGTRWTPVPPQTGVTSGVEQGFDAKILKKAPSKAGARSVGLTSRGPDTCPGAGQCQKDPGKNDRVLWVQVPEDLSCVLAQFEGPPKAKLRDDSRVSPNHRNVDEGLSGA